MDFEYKITKKNEQLLIITLKGNIDKKTKDPIEQILKDIAAFEQKIVVLLFNEVFTIDKSIYREFTVLLHETRKRNKALFLVGLEQSLKIELDQQGLIRSGEIKTSIEDAIKSLR